MPEWSKFSDIEIDAIKDKMNQKFDKAMIGTLIASPIMCLIMPYIPGRYDRVPMIDEMPYWDAVLKMSIIWIFVLIGVLILNYFKSQNQFSKNRKFLKKKNIVGQIVKKNKGFFASYENSITTNLRTDLSKLKIEKEEAQNFSVGDHIEIQYEELTKTIFKIVKVDKQRANNKK